MLKRFLIIDMPAGISPEDAERLLNEPYEQGYYLRSIVPWPGVGARAVYQLLAKLMTDDEATEPAGPKADADGREEEAIQVIRAHPDFSLRDIVVKLEEAGIKRSRSWVGEKRLKLLGTGTKLSK